MLSSPVPPAAPARPPRPVTVTVASWLQLGTAALLLLLAALVVTHGLHYAGEIDRIAGLTEADPVEVSDERTGNVVMTLLVAVPAVLLAGWFAAAARPLRRGSNGARILTFVAVGTQLLLGCGLCGVGVLMAPMIFVLAATDPEPLAHGEESEFYEMLYTDPDLLGELLFVGGSLDVLAIFAFTVAVVLLLALPSANRFFVPRAEPAPPGPWPAVWPGAPYPAGPVPAGAVRCAEPARHVDPPQDASEGNPE